MIELIEILLGAVRYFVISDTLFDTCSAVVASATVIIVLVAVLVFCHTILKSFITLFKR